AALKNMNWSDPATYGEIAGNLATFAVGGAAAVKAVSLITKVSAATRAAGELSMLGRTGQEAAAATRTAAQAEAVEGAGPLGAQFALSVEEAAAVNPMYATS